MNIDELIKKRQDVYNLWYTYSTESWMYIEEVLKDLKHLKEEWEVDEDLKEQFDLMDSDEIVYYANRNTRMNWLWTNIEEAMSNQVPMTLLKFPFPQEQVTVKDVMLYEAWLETGRLESQEQVSNYDKLENEAEGIRTRNTDFLFDDVKSD